MTCTWMERNKEYYPEYEKDHTVIYVVYRTRMMGHHRKVQDLRCRKRRIRLITDWRARDRRASTEPVSPWRKVLVTVYCRLQIMTILIRRLQLNSRLWNSAEFVQNTKRFTIYCTVAVTVTESHLLCCCCYCYWVNLYCIVAVTVTGSHFAVSLLLLLLGLTLLYYCCYCY
jgi:hypothetical protein